MNILAILVAAAAMFIIGFLWHGPLFGKAWMKMAGIVPTGNESFTGMIPQMAWNYAANVLLVAVFAEMVTFIGQLGMPFTWSTGAIFAIWIWLGFLVPTTSTGVIWMKQSKKLWLFELSSHLAAFAAMGAIIGGWH